MFHKRQGVGLARCGLLLAGAVSLIVFSRPAHADDLVEWLGVPPAGAKLPLVISVEAAYPGANAQVVADTVAAPIEQQVNGVEKMRSMRSRCRNDGTYTLHVTFKEGTDANMVQVLVQNRVSLALPVLPDAVIQRGITVKKKSPRPIMIVTVRSPDGSRDIRVLSNEATVGLTDELARLPGTGDVTCAGCTDRGVRVKLDPAKMMANNVTASDVAAAVREENAQVGAGQIGQPPGQGFQLTITGLGRLADAKQVGDIVLKTGAGGRVVRLKDVAQVEAESGPQRSQALLNGKPVVALAVYLLPGAGPRQVSAAVQARLAKLRRSFPKGIDADAGFDFTPNLEAPGRTTTPEYLLLDLILPSGASVERTLKVFAHCQALLHDVAGVQDVLELSENPFDPFPARPCFLVRLAPADKRSAGREKIVETIRSRLAQVAEATVRLRDWPGPGGFRGSAYPVAMAIEDRGGLGQKNLGELAGKLAKRLRETKKLTDVWADSEVAPSPQIYVDIDRAKAAAQGVTVSDINVTLQAALGALDVNDSNRFGQTWQVRIESDIKKPDDIGKLAVRSGSGQMVALSTVAAVRTTAGPAFIDRLDLYPMVEVSANPAAGVSLDQIHALCETLFAEVRKELGLGEGYQLSWL
jgi:multidrug efflux pump subunit AcrB